jgi:very-short-patch-repair endonuclease
MPIENQTLSFIETTYDGVTETIRQHCIGQYRVDMYFPKYNIIIECDEFNHSDRNKLDELERDKYLISQGNRMIRYNPNRLEFDMSIVLRDINRIIMT